MEAEPLLPIEKKLIAWSLILGVVLLAILIWTGNSAPDASALERATPLRRDGVAGPRLSLLSFASLFRLSLSALGAD